MENRDANCRGGAYFPIHPDSRQCIAILFLKRECIGNYPSNGQGRLTVYKFNTPPLYKKVDNYSNLCCGDDRGLSRKVSGADSNESRPTNVCLHYIRSVGDLKFYLICIPFVFSTQGSPAEFNCVMFNSLVHIWQ